MSVRFHVMLTYTVTQERWSYDGLDPRHERMSGTMLTSMSCWTG